MQAVGRPPKNPKPQVHSPESAFGTVLRKARNQCSLSQEALAFKAGYHRNFISQLERGEKSPSLRTIVNLATVLELKPSDMLKKMERIVNSSRS